MLAGIVIYSQMLAYFSLDVAASHM